MPKQIIMVNPFRCRLWDLHDRFETSVSEESCRAEIESFSRHGQIVPALGRPVRGDPDYDVELICGARRLFVARHIKKDLAVELRDISDREALILMDTENRQRTDISAYERGMSYVRWLRSGHFQSQEDIARALKISGAQVSRLLKLTRLPAVVVNAFASPAEIHESWGLDLIEALDDAERRQPTIDRARSITRQGRRLSGAEVYRQLLASSGKGRRPKASTHDEIVKDDSGRPLFRIRQLRSSIAVMLPVEHVPAQTLDAIRSTLSNLLSVAPVEVRVEEFRKPASEIRVVPPAAQPARVISRMSKVGAARNASA
jgi:ParB family transcriptional regulator, chromosome partitioning protein